MDPLSAGAPRSVPGTLFYFLSSTAASRMYGSPEGAAPAVVRAQVAPDTATVSPLGRFLSHIADRYFDSLESPTQFDRPALEGFVVNELRSLPTAS